MAVRLIESLATTASLAEIFSDTSLLQAMLEFEVALARAEAHLHVIPQAAAETIAAVAPAASFDSNAIADQAVHAGTPAIPFVRQLTAHVRSRDAVAAGFVHWGATSQDVCDTALVLVLRKARSILESGLERLEVALQRLSNEHAGTVMLARTLLQPAPPTTFGLKAAGWLAAVHRGRERLSAALDAALLLQFGGASGTLAALGNQGIAVGQALAAELHLPCPDAPWHTHRDRLATMVCACGVLAGSIGKMARDISLLMQAEVEEVAEPIAEDRGGSSAMPHKQNPVGCSAALTAVVRVPALVSSFLSAMAQEHERGLGGWQAEWPIIAGIVQNTGLAVSTMAEVAAGLTVDPRQMQANLAAHDAVFAERAMMLLAEKLGRHDAQKLLEEAAHISRKRKIKLKEALAQIPEVKDHMDAALLDNIDVPEQYLGMAEEFRKRLLACRTKR